MTSAFNPEIQYYCTAFVDMLGQRAKLREITKLPESEDDPKFAETGKLIIETLGVVHDLRESFRHFYENFGQVTPIIEQIPEPDQSKIRAARQSPVYMHGLGDGLALSASLRTDGPPLAPLNGIFAILASTGGIALLSLAAGRPLRGGIDVGIGGLISESEVYGPSILRAVELEGTRADYPRIAVGDELSNYLNAVSRMPIGSKLDEVSVTLAKHVARLLFFDRDGQLCLDYLGEAVRQMNNPALSPDRIRRAVDWANAELEHHRGRGDQLLVRRYELLTAYLGARAYLWLNA